MKNLFTKLKEKLHKLKKKLQKLPWRPYQEYYFAWTGGILILVFLIMALVPSLFTSYDPMYMGFGDFTPPNWTHPLGTTKLGMDLYSRIIFGARTVMLVVFLSISISLSVGLPLGLFAGYFGGYIDRSISLVMDALYAFPGLVLAIALAFMLGPGILNTAASLGMIYIPTYFRMIRSEVLSVKEETYITAAQSLGASDFKIIRKYVFPNVIRSLPVIISLNATDAVLTNAALSFIGLGIPGLTPSWGKDLRKGWSVLTAGYWWLSFFPGLMICLLGFGFSLLGEGLDDIMNPLIQRERGVQR